MRTKPLTVWVPLSNGDAVFYTVDESGVAHRLCLFRLWVRLVDYTLRKGRSIEALECRWSSTFEIARLVNAH